MDGNGVIYVIDVFDNDNLNYHINQDNPIEFLFIDQLGKIYALYKSQLGSVVDCNGEFIVMNNHYDMLYYFVKKMKVVDDDKLVKLRERNNFVDYVKLLIEKDYIIISNFTYYGVIKKDELDLFIAINHYVDDEQLLVLKNMVNVFDNDNLHINLCLFEIGQDGKAINTMEENLYSFNDLIAILNSGSKSK